MQDLNPSTTAPATPPPPGRTRAYFVVWQCACSDVQTDQSSIPERCPGHDRPRISRDGELIDALDEFVGVHDCGPNACAEAATR